MAIIEHSSQSREGVFLGNALAPMPASKAADSFLKIRHAPLSWLEDARLDREAAIVLSNPGKISSAAAEQLKNYVEKGGCLFIFPGSATEPASLNTSLEALLPARLGTLHEVSPTPSVWNSGPHSHPVTTFWNDKPESSLGSVATAKFFPLEISRPGAQTVVAYADGSPAVVEGSFGSGRVILFSAPPDLKWTNLPLNPNFVPLMQRLLAQFSAARPQTDGVLEAGVPFQKRIAENAVGRPIWVSAPDTKERKPAGHVTKFENSGLVLFRDTLSAGPYRLFLEGSEIALAAFAVEVPAAESELQIAPEDSLVFAASHADLKPALASNASSPRVEVWWTILLMALLVAVLEMGMAHRFSLSK